MPVVTQEQADQLRTEFGYRLEDAITSGMSRMSADDVFKVLLKHVFLLLSEGTYEDGTQWAAQVLHKRIDEYVAERNG